MGDISNFEFDTISIFFFYIMELSIFFENTKLISILPLNIDISSLVDISIDFIEKNVGFFSFV